MTGCSDSGPDPVGEQSSAPTVQRSTSPAATSSSGLWAPKPGQSWVIQLNGTPTQQAEVITLDGVDATPAQVTAIRERGQHPVCYINAGAYEDWRADASSFPQALIGKGLDGWAGENWLDIRAVEQLRPLMAARMDSCQAKGFEAVDPDNVDGFANDSGFDLSATDEQTYLRMLIELAHQRGLSVGLKNALDLLPQIGPEVDFAVNEECQQFNECERYDAFVASGKAVLNIEYRGTLAQVCRPRTGFTIVLAPANLDGPLQQCR